MTPKRAISIAIGGAVALGALYLAADWMYLGRAGELRDQLRTAERNARGYNEAAEGFAGALGRLRDAFGQTLGTDAEHVEHELRARLADLARLNGLADVVVSNADPRGEPNPVAEARVPRAWRPLRARVGGRADFAVVRGRVEGEGSLAAALSMLGAMRAQPWLHRVESFSIRPVGRERVRYEFKADFAVAYAGDVPATADGAASPTPQAERDAVASIINRNLFKAPALEAAPVVVAAPAPEPPRPSAPAFDAWRLAGLTVTDHAEAIVVGPSGLSVGRARGPGVVGAVFVGGQGERGVFVIDGQRFEVELGRTLAERRGLED